jgi:hypothetical protein
MTSSRLHIPIRRPWDVIPYLGRGHEHWRVGYSAHALMHTWFAAAGLPARVKVVLASHPLWRDFELLDAFAERETNLGDPHKASQTDILAVGRVRDQLAILAVEGKVEESFGDFVAQWRQDKPSAAKDSRLLRISAMLGLEGDPNALRYQLLHRTAAALIEARKYNAAAALMLVHSFSRTRSGFEDYRRFASALGCADLAPERVVGPVDRNGLQLFLGWVSDELPVVADRAE